MGRSRSLGTHLALTHGLIALLGCAISGGLLALFLPTIYLRQHEDHLLRQAEGVAEQVAPGLAGVATQPEFLFTGIEAAGVSIVDAQQRVVTVIGQGAGRGRGGGWGRASRSGIDDVWRRQWAAIQAGEHVHGRAQLSNGEQVHVVAVPARYGDKTVGAVVLHARLADLQGASSAIVPVIAAASLAAVLIALLVGVALSERVARPLQRMTVAAQRIADEDLNVRVEAPSWREGQSLAHAFNQMTESLARQETARRHFVADASHQLRAPLTSLQAQAEALLDNMIADDAKRREFLARIVADATHLSSLVQELLTLERLDAVADEPRRQALAVDEVVRDAIAGLPEETRERVDADAAPLLGEGDPSEVRQALENLLENALKYSPAGSRVGVAVGSEGDQVRISVHNLGPGISADHLPRVWDRFFRAPGESAEGTGLGLAITKRLIERQGGQVRAESAPGEGATFSFTLPRSRRA